MRVIYPHGIDLDALRARLAIGDLTREEACEALTYLLDRTMPEQESATDDAEERATDAEDRVADVEDELRDAEDELRDAEKKIARLERLLDAAGIDHIVR